MSANPPDGAPRQPQQDDVQQWSAILLATLTDAIELLQVAVFEESWEAVRATTEDHEAAFRDLLRMYEQGLADLLRFIRACGLPANAVAWSQLKTDWRRASVEADEEPTLRSALESGLYVAEQTPLATHAIYQQWASDLMAFVGSLPESPAPVVTDEQDDARLQWAVAHLAPLEEHGHFHAAFAEWCASRGAATLTSRAHDDRLLLEPRYDLVLNTALRWLAGY